MIYGSMPALYTDDFDPTLGPSYIVDTSIQVYCLHLSGVQNRRVIRTLGVSKSISVEHTKRDQDGWLIDRVEVILNGGMERCCILISTLLKEEDGGRKL